MIISAKQIKMARAMLDWSQEDLARASRLSPNTIYNLEKGNVSFRKLMDVRRAFESKGVEFLGTNGVNRRPDEHKTYSGANSCDEFCDALLETVKESSCEVAAIFDTQENLAHSLGATNCASIERLEKLSRLTKVKCLISDPNNLSTVLPFFEFRAVPKSFMPPMPIFLYDDKLALVITDGSDLSFLVAHSIYTVQRELKRFAATWKDALPIPMQRNLKTTRT